MHRIQWHDAVRIAQLKALTQIGFGQARLSGTMPTGMILQTSSGSGGRQVAERNITDDVRESSATDSLSLDATLLSGTLSTTLGNLL